MNLQNQKKWGQPLDYNPDEECHVKQQYTSLFDSILKPLVCLIAFAGMVITLYGVVVEFMHYYVR